MIDNTWLMRDERSRIANSKNILIRHLFICHLSAGTMI
jgi:hypothetical protein